MRLAAAVAVALVTGCAAVKSRDPGLTERNTPACHAKLEQLAEDNAPRDETGRQRKVECMLAEMHALQQCEIWFRSERVGALFDQKMSQCVQRHNYFETPGDCSQPPL
jgi:hypothetical protein